MPHRPACTIKSAHRITLKSEARSNLKAQNGVAVIPGTQSDEVIVVDAHVDAWFDGAGDNADGFSVMLALARHFSKPENKPRRTMAFIASAGHHTSGINGPGNFLTANPELARKTVLVLNIEHVAQRNFSVARSEASDGYRQAIADSGEAPTYAGINNKSPFINELFQKGVQRYGNNFVSDESDMGSGEMGGFQPVKAAALVTIMQAPPLYHTTGETLDVISTPGSSASPASSRFSCRRSIRRRGRKSSRSFGISSAPIALPRLSCRTRSLRRGHRLLDAVTDR